ncbi:transcription factor IIIB 60 kDa subunit isoform X2 [Andrographis paniculata]|uniref:transcription factor IIIB 60 kDa subunit isoform X2 n=1 Tax=Andrographis paniculata TaxID=175694 RepID=UPI0021E89D30|nr:transcription factor IIIB 60 kDa subunit isoform X2 [Andrographis paniculata]
MWCRNCADDVPAENFDGKICCPGCGRVLIEDNFSQEPTFVKGSAGQSQLSGTIVRSSLTEYSVSRQRTVDEARRGIEDLMYKLEIDGGDSIANPALAFYKLGLEWNFTRGRKKEQVEAACLYIACRLNNKPYLLIEFSEQLSINVYVLGAVFLQLCKVLYLQEHPIVQKPVDPSLFIHRFTDRLFGGRKPVDSTRISQTALRVVASMKRDWMQTGRKPSGLCGAALYIAALSHDLPCSKNDIIKVVHICETTLTKRLIEFENTESGGLTIEEFNTKATEIETEEMLSKSLDEGVKASGIHELLCQHKGSETPHFAHGLCRSCYDDFMKLSGGLEGGSEPPAFQRAEKGRMMEEKVDADRSNDLESSILPDSAESQSKVSNSNKQCRTNDLSENEVPQTAESGLTGDQLQQEDMDHSNIDGIHPNDDTLEESENLSDIDDTEVDFYLNNEEEKRLKKIIWEEMNKEYLEEQAAKEASELAAKKAEEEFFANCSEEVKAEKLKAAQVAAAVAKSKKERQQKRAAERKLAGPAQTASEAAKQMLERKGFSSKIRYDVLEQMFDESENTEKTKKMRTSGEDDDKSSNWRSEEVVEEPIEGEDCVREDINCQHEENNIDDYDDDDNDLW